MYIRMEVKTLKLMTLIAGGEGKKVEFKEILPASDKIMKTAVAFSNGAGGKLIIGIKDDGQIIGISDEDVFELPDKISNIVYDGCYPTIIPEIYTEAIEDKVVLVVEFYPGNLKPYYLKSKKKLAGTYVRVGATNKQADEEMIRNIERQKRNICFDEEICYEVDISQLDIRKIQEDFYQLTGKKMDNAGMKNLNLIKSEGQNDYPTNGLILLSANETFFEYARIKCARFKGNDIGEFIDQKEFSGALYEQVDNAIKFAKQYIAKNGKITDIQRIDKYEIPIVAIREAIINAVVHRDYGILGADIKIAIFDDRIEITSPGALPKTLDVEDILEGRSEIRNRVIARFFKEINYIEQWGTGIRRIIKECDDKGLVFPTIKETGNFFKIILYKRLDTDADKLPTSADKLPISADKLLTENEKLIVEYLEQHNSITNKIAREQIGLKETATKNLLKKMSEKQLIVAVGKGKGRHYILYSK